MLRIMISKLSILNGFGLDQKKDFTMLKLDWKRAGILIAHLKSSMETEFLPLEILTTINKMISSQYRMTKNHSNPTITRMKAINSLLVHLLLQYLQATRYHLSLSAKINSKASKQYLLLYKMDRLLKSSSTRWAQMVQATQSLCLWLPFLLSITLNHFSSI